ncbi:MAG: GNAT family N-acetyltransferase [Gemmatimonadales bacterium]
MNDGKLYRCRVAAQSDIPALLALINLAYRVEAFFIKGQRTSTEELRELIAAPDADFLVLEAAPSGALAGSIYVKRKGEASHLGFIAVDPALQGQRLGHRLIAEAADHARAQGCTALELDVFDVREELHGFYRSAGFTETGTAPFEPKELLLKPAHLIQMRKSIA